MDKTGFPVTGCDIIDAECLASVPRVSKLDLMATSVRMRVGWNWLRVMSSDKLWFNNVELLDSAVMELVKPVVHKVYSAGLEGFTTSSKGVCKYISLMATLKFSYFFN
jgi:hypothetical protein